MDSTPQPLQNSYEMNLPDERQLDLWRGEYGDIYRIIIAGNTFIYRRLTIGRYRNIIAASRNDCELQDNLIREALLYPSDPDLDNIPAMVPVTLSKGIIKSSMLDGTVGWDTYLNDRRKKLTPRRDRDTGTVVVDDPIIPLVIEVCKAFPGYTPDDLMELTIPELLDRVSLAELLMGGIQPDKPTTMPSGMTGSDRQQFLVDQSADASTRALREEVERNARAKS